MIVSPQNPKIKNVVRLLEKASERRGQNLTVAEGEREIGLAVRAGWAVQALFVCREVSPQPADFGLSADAVWEVNQVVFDKIAYRENRDGLVALVTPKKVQLSDIRLSRNPLVIVLESVEKPGNLGAVLRTADAARVDAVLVCDPQTDLYNPNVIRSSVGCLFTTQTAVCTSEAALRWLRQHGIRTYAAALTAKQLYHETDLSGRAALVMGTEATGLSSHWLQVADAQIKIPMRGEIDSLNVSTSTAILVFEAMRQRGFV
ncbi:MAG: RNA methyltransferase [Cytophagales bacterium]|nr:RNA methyltransferase [Cytophagales bacterium]